MGVIPEWVRQHEANWGGRAKERKPAYTKEILIWEVGSPPAFQLEVLGERAVQILQKKDSWVRRVCLTEDPGEPRKATFWVTDPGDSNTEWVFQIKEDIRTKTQDIIFSRWQPYKTEKIGVREVTELGESLSGSHRAFVEEMLGVARGERRFDFESTLYMIRGAIKLVDSGSGESELALLDALNELDGLIWVTSPVE